MPTTSPYRLPGPGVASRTTAALAAVVGAVVLGIVGMHGLAQHGAMPGHGTQQPVQAGVAAHTDAHTAAHAVMGHTSAAEVTDGSRLGPKDGTGAAAAGAGTGGSPGDIAMLCAVMLLAAAAGTLLVLRLRRLAHRAHLTRRSATRAPRPRTTARTATGPPCVWELSVVRC